MRCDAPHEVLVFTVGGEYGHFRKINTTTSPLTYSLPGPTALAGLVGAVLGMPKEDSQGQLPEADAGSPAEAVCEAFAPSRCRWAVQVLQPIKKVYVAFNLLNTKSWATHYRLDGKSHKGRTQVEFELLKTPSYRVALWWQHPRRDELARRLQQRSHHYSPYLGLAQFTATLRWQGSYTTTPLAANELTPCHSAVNLNALEATGTEAPVQFAEGRHYHTDTLPMAMNIRREVSQYAELLLGDRSLFIGTGFF